MYSIHDLLDSEHDFLDSMHDLLYTIHEIMYTILDHDWDFVRFKTTKNSRIIVRIGIQKNFFKIPILSNKN